MNSQRMNHRSGKKRIISRTAFAAAVFLALSMREIRTAYGAGERGPYLKTAEETKVIFPVGDKRTDVDTEVKGNIGVSLISVALPSDVEFTVDPGGVFDASASPDGQIQSPSGFRVINQSVIPVRLEISRVEEIRQGELIFSQAFTGGPKQRFQLVETVSEAGTRGNAILVLGKTGSRYADNADFEQFAICPGRTGIPVAEVAAGENAELQIYGKVSADFYGSYQFTVRPTLKISAAKNQ